MLDTNAPLVSETYSIKLHSSLMNLKRHRVLIILQQSAVDGKSPVGVSEQRDLENQNEDSSGVTTNSNDLGPDEDDFDMYNEEETMSYFSELVSEAPSENTIRGKKERALGLPFGTEAILKYGETDDENNSTDNSDDESTAVGDNSDAQSFSSWVTDSTFPGFEANVYPLTGLLGQRLVATGLAAAEEVFSPALPPPVFHKCSAASSQRNKARDPNRGDMRQVETGMVKGELMRVRPWAPLADRKTFQGKADDYKGRVRLWIHEAFHLQRMRRDAGVTENRIRDHKDGPGKEWLLEAIAYGVDYLARTQKEIEKMPEGQEQDSLFIALQTSHMWINRIEANNSCPITTELVRLPMRSVNQSKREK